MNICSLWLLYLKLNYSPAYTIKKIILRRCIARNFPELCTGFQIQHAQVTGITVHLWIISVGNDDYDPWTCEMILGTAYQYNYIPFPHCAEKINSPPVKPLGVELNKLDYPLMSAYSVMNTGTRTPPVLCHSHYSYTGQNYFDVNLVGDRVHWLLINEVKVRIFIRPKSFHIWNKLNKKIITLRRKFF